MDGTLYEYRFIERALTKRLHPHASIGDYLPHDIIILNDAGKVFRVQVKGTHSFKETSTSNTSRWRITAGSGRVQKKRLDCSKVDVLAAHIGELDVWYLIPCLRLTAVSLWLYPESPESKAQFEPYKENWDIFLD